VFEDFDHRRITTTGAEIDLVMAGSGPPLLLLHGYPQTRAMWHLVAPRLAHRFTVVCPDLRGYGMSTKPPTRDDHAQSSKRAMAADVVRLMRELGHERFGPVDPPRPRC
jgi:haloacetate dehalogenase